MVTKTQLSKMKGWYYPHISSKLVMEMSGWKLYVFGEDIDDSYAVCQLLLPVVEKYDITMKVATRSIIARNSGTSIAWSIAVIYLTPEMFNENKIRNFVSEISTSLQSYCKTGSVNGAKSLDGKLHYRYDLNKPIDPKKGVRYEEYIEMYRGEYGDFNIPDNEDIESFLKEKV